MTKHEKKELRELIRRWRWEERAGRKLAVEFGRQGWRTARDMSITMAELAARYATQLGRILRRAR